MVRTRSNGAHSPPPPELPKSKRPTRRRSSAAAPDDTPADSREITYPDQNTPAPRFAIPLRAPSSSSSSTSTASLQPPSPVAQQQRSGSSDMLRAMLTSNLNASRLVGLGITNDTLPSTPPPSQPQNATAQLLFPLSTSEQALYGMDGAWDDGSVPWPQIPTFPGPILVAPSPQARFSGEPISNPTLQTQQEALLRFQQRRSEAEALTRASAPPFSTPIATHQHPTMPSSSNGSSKSSETSPPYPQVGSVKISWQGSSSPTPYPAAPPPQPRPTWPFTPASHFTSPIPTTSNAPSQDWMFNGNSTAMSRGASTFSSYPASLSSSTASRFNASSFRPTPPPPAVSQTSSISSLQAQMLHQQHHQSTDRGSPTTTSFATVHPAATPATMTTNEANTQEARARWMQQLGLATPLTTADEGEDRKNRAMTERAWWC